MLLFVGGEQISHQRIKIESGEVSCKKKGNFLAKVTAASCRSDAQRSRQ